MSPEERAAEAIKLACPTCHADPGRKCRKVGGWSFRPMPRPHAARLTLVIVDAIAEQFGTDDPSSRQP